jgi:hypothetical protein
MDGDPFARNDPGRQPRGETEQPGSQRMKRQRAVRDGAVQVDRRAEDHDLERDDGDAESDEKISQHMNLTMRSETQSRLKDSRQNGRRRT